MVHSPATRPLVGARPLGAELLAAAARVVLPRPVAGVVPARLPPVAPPGNAPAARPAPGLGAELLSTGLLPPRVEARPDGGPAAGSRFGSAFTALHPSPHDEQRQDRSPSDGLGADAASPSPSTTGRPDAAPLPGLLPDWWRAGSTAWSAPDREPPPEPGPLPQVGFGAAATPHVAPVGEAHPSAVPAAPGAVEPPLQRVRRLTDPATSVPVTRRVGWPADPLPDRRATPSIGPSRPAPGGPGRPAPESSGQPGHHDADPADDLPRTPGPATAEHGPSAQAAGWDPWGAEPSWQPEPGLPAAADAAYGAADHRRALPEPTAPALRRVVRPAAGRVARPGARFPAYLSLPDLPDLPDVPDLPDLPDGPEPAGPPDRALPADWPALAEREQAGAGPDQPATTTPGRSEAGRPGAQSEDELAAGLRHALLVERERAGTLADQW